MTVQLPGLDGSPADRCAPIADHAVVGDGRSAALIARDGSIDWYCPGRFDAPAVFCRLLDSQKGGHWSIRPARPATATRRYVGVTNVLETTFTDHSGHGRVRVTDLMPVQPAVHLIQPQTASERCSQQVLRLVEADGTDAEAEILFRPTFDYARADTTVKLRKGQGAVATGPSGATLVLACPADDLRQEPTGAVRGRLRLRAGERRWLVLSYCNKGCRAHRLVRPDSDRLDQQLRDTLRYWERWAADCTYGGLHRDLVVRSALVLKLLTYEPTGAIVAAPTTSLPEQIGGSRNWDYRYTWLRDGAMSASALMQTGHTAEAGKFLEWLPRLQWAEGSPPPVMATVDGRGAPEEVELTHLEGYRGSAPVRIGNAAAQQTQLDVAGEVLEAAEGLYSERPPSREAWSMLRRLVDTAARRWRDADCGIWEVRHQPQHFLHSRLMCWVALDRGLRLAIRHRLPAPIADWRTARSRLRRAVLRSGFRRERGCFTRSLRSDATDASVLALPATGLLPPGDPRMLATLERVQAELGRGALVDRYRVADGLEGGEGAFVLCSSWLIGALALAGRVERAERLFEQLVWHANDVGLLAEEIDPASNRQLGNFPQGLSHVALIDAAVHLANAGGRARRRAA